MVSELSDNFVFSVLKSGNIYTSMIHIYDICVHIYHISTCTIYNVFICTCKMHVQIYLFISQTVKNQPVVQETQV